MRVYKYLTDEQKKKIREMSRTHYVKEIAAAVGCDKRTVLNIQRVSVANPKRKIKYRQPSVASKTEKKGYFDIDKWAKEMLY